MIRVYFGGAVLAILTVAAVVGLFAGVDVSALARVVSVARTLYAGEAPRVYQPGVESLAEDARHLREAAGGGAQVMGYIVYRVVGHEDEFRAGPYKAGDEIRSHMHDILIYEGVSFIRFDWVAESEAKEG